MNRSSDQEVPQLFSARLSQSPLRRGATPVVQGPILSVVVPLFDEEANLPELLTRLRNVLRPLNTPFELVLVNDGSRDRTGLLLDLFAGNDPNLVVVHLSRNFGHQAAVAAGLRESRGRAVVVLDGDLQDPPELVPQMLDRWRGGSEVVYAVRSTRQGLGVLQPVYRGFYRLLNWWAEHPIPLDAGDCCLMDRRVVDILCQAGEQPRFLRGLRAYAGFKQSALAYDRPDRFAGQSKYGLRKLFGLAMNGFFHFTPAPAKLVWAIAWSCLALVAIVPLATQLWPSPQLWTFAVLLGLALVAFGLAVAVEYLQRILVQVQGRPGFIVREVRRGESPNTEPTP